MRTLEKWLAENILNKRYMLFNEHQNVPALFTKVAVLNTLICTSVCVRLCTCEYFTKKMYMLHKTIDNILILVNYLRVTI